MAEVISIYKGDTLPALEVNFFDYNVVTGVETPTNLSAVGIVVTLRTQIVGEAIKTDAPLTAVDATTGKFKYEWVEADTDTAGDYIGEISIEYPDGVNPAKIRTALKFILSVLDDIV